jgi:hypothetical protein
VRRLAVLLALLAIGSCRAHTGEPTVTVVYSPSLDSICSLVRGGTIEEDWSRELEDRKAEFEESWTAAGPKLIDATEALTGKPFPAEDFTARLTLCDLPSQSFVGISVNMRYALRSFSSTPVPMRYKVDTLFHELLHKYLSEHPVSGSDLLAQHAAEPTRVQNHLHLLALQKAVLMRVGDVQALKDDIAIDSELPGGYYMRAWEIVNATDNEYLSYVAELRK